jgi:hypothetical protein
MGNFKCNSISRKLEIKTLLHSIEIKNDNPELIDFQKNFIYENEFILFALSNLKNPKIKKNLIQTEFINTASDFDIRQSNPVLKDFLEYEINKNSCDYLEKRIKYIDKWLQMIKLGYLEYKKSKNLLIMQDKDTGFSSISSKNNITKYIKFYCENYSNQIRSKISKSPPHSLRFISWKALHSFHLDISDYNQLLNNQLEKNIEDWIRKDICRTFPENDKDKEEKLYRVLKVFSLIDREINYCQGMNFIAGFLLIMSNFNEVETLCLFISLFMMNENILRGFYLDGFAVLKLFIFQFEKYLEKKEPKISSKFKYLNLPCEIWISPWFLCFFSANLPLIFAVRVWDCLLSYGLNFLIVFALCYMKYFRDEILNCQDSGDLLQVFRNFVEHPLQSIPNTNKNFKIEKVICEAIDLLAGSFSQELKSFEQEYNKLNSITCEEIKKLLKFDYYPEINKLLKLKESNHYIQNIESKNRELNITYQTNSTHSTDKKVIKASHPIQIEMISLKLKLEDYFPNENFDVNLENCDDYKIKIPKRSFFINPSIENK